MFVPYIKSSLVPLTCHLSLIHAVLRTLFICCLIRFDLLSYVNSSPRKKKSSHPDDFTESHLFAWICRGFFLSYIFKTWWFSSWINFILHSRVVVECWVLRMLLNEISWRSWFVLDLALERALCLNEIHGQWAEIKREHCIQHEQDVWNAICWNVLKCSSLSSSPLLSLSLFLTHTATFHTCLPHFISGTI